MKFSFKTIFFLIILLASVSVAYSAGVCCYYPDRGIEAEYEGICEEGGIEILEIDFSEDPFCRYESKRVCCPKDGLNYDNFFGDKVYDYQEVYDFLSLKHGLAIDDWCDGNLIDYDSNNCESGNMGPPEIIVGINTGGSTGGGVSGPPIDPEEIGNLIPIIEAEERVFCSDSNGLTDFFITGLSCNGLTNDDTSFPCIFNPYLTGLISVFSSVDLSYGLFENGCMPKRSIRNCYDYKTSEICINNIVSIAFPENDNLKSCRWVPTSDYFNSTTGNYFDTGSGICVSDAISNSKHFNLASYIQRGNLLKNPSFEDGNSGWTGLTTGSSIRPFHGDNYAILTSGSSISQILSNLGSLTYNTVLYIKGDSAFTSTDELILEIYEYDSSDSLITAGGYSIPITLDGYKQRDGVFQKVDFGRGYTVDANTEYIKFEISTTTDINIDAVSFEYIGEADMNIISGMFKPLEIIPSEASSCELCFDDLNINTCTETKSDLLGDCSYMVPDLSEIYESSLGGDYLGDKEDFYLNNSLKWQSQSIANSELFCELYITDTSCTDTANYINQNFAPLHPESGSTLCKWNSVRSCFKDSD